MRRTPGSLVILSLLVACGGGPATSDAGDSGVDAEDTGVIAAPPDIPWLDAGAPPIAEPVLTPCPPGWSELVREDRPVTCHPYDGEPEVCPDGSAHFIGDEACTPVGAPCPMGDFPEGLPTDVEVLYVLSSAPAGGDGTEGSPLMTITDAMNIAARGTVIAIGKGTYDEAVRVGPGITLWGACARDTRVTASSPGSFAQGVLMVPSPDVQLKNLNVGPANLPGVALFGPSASASLDGLIIEGVQLFGIYVIHGAAMDGRELSISGTRSDTAGGFGRGLLLQDGATAVVTRALFSRNRDAGVSAAGGGTSVTLSDVVVDDTQGQVSDGTGGAGISVQFGATAVVTRALFSRNRGVGVFVDGEDTSATLSDVIVRDTRAQEGHRIGGRGLSAQRGATATVTRALFSRNRELGVFASGGGTSVTLSNLVVQDTQAQASDGAAGWGLGIEMGATAEVSCALFSGNHDVGVLVDGGGSSLTLSNVVVEDTRQRMSDGTGGWGLSAQRGATAMVTHGLFSGNRRVGILATDPGTLAVFSDVAVRQTNGQSCGPAPCPDHPFGVALAGVTEASLVVTRFEAVDSALCGVMIARDGQVDLSTGQVSGAPIGVCLQVEDYAITRLTESVRFLDNGTNLDTTSLPVPEPSRRVDTAE